MVDAPAPTPRRPARLLRLASLAAAEGRLRGDPVVLLAAARLERMAGAVPVRSPPATSGAWSPTEPGSADTRAWNGLLGFDRLVQDARACAEDEAGLVEAMCRELEGRAPQSPGAQSWSGRLPPRAFHEIMAPGPAAPGLADVALAWAGTGGGWLGVSVGTGEHASDRALRGAAYAGCWSDRRPIRIRVANEGDHPADYAVTLGWPARP